MIANYEMIISIYEAKNDVNLTLLHLNLNNDQQKYFGF